MRRLRSPYVNSVVINSGIHSASIPIVHNNGNVVWVIEQIAVTYSNANDSVTASVVQNGVVFTGGTMVPSANGLSQTFSGTPALYSESLDMLSVNLGIANGSTGGTGTIYVAYRSVNYDDSELDGRF